MSTLPVPGKPAWQQPQMFYGKPLTFNERNHRYYWDGQPVPSVTTIIGRLSKPLLIQWAADCAVDRVRHAFENPPKDCETVQEFANRFKIVLEEARRAHTVIRGEAGDIGKLVHDHARAMLDPAWKRSLPDPQLKKHPQAVKALAALEDWRSQHTVEPIAIERRVMSAQQMYAGTVDFYGHIDGELGVLDFKTGNGVYDEAWWQTCGYGDALAEEHGLVAHETMPRWIVHLSKADGSFTVHRRGLEDTHDYSVWRGLVAVDKALRVARKHPQPKKARAA